MNVLALLLLITSPLAFANPQDALINCLSGNWEGKGHFVDSLTGSFGDCTLAAKVKPINSRQISLDWSYTCPTGEKRVVRELALEDGFSFFPYDKKFQHGMWDFNGLKLVDVFKKTTVDIRSNRSNGVNPKCSILTLRSEINWDRELFTVTGSMVRKKN